jgi:hypothetical protein
VFNCNGCHANGGGDKGPALMDDKWLFGGEIENIYAKIVQGRPNRVEQLPVPSGAKAGLAPYLERIVADVDPVLERNVVARRARRDCAQAASLGAAQNYRAADAVAAGIYHQPLPHPASCKGAACGPGGNCAGRPGQFAAQRP